MYLFVFCEIQSSLCEMALLLFKINQDVAKSNAFNVSCHSFRSNECNPFIFGGDTGKLSCVAIIFDIAVKVGEKDWNFSRRVPWEDQWFLCARRYWMGENGHNHK